MYMIRNISFKSIFSLVFPISILKTTTQAIQYRNILWVRPLPVVVL